eukprot:SAG31_NODE_35026_length_327_cov_0.614035_2_plen_45_part_01
MIQEQLKAEYGSHSDASDIESLYLLHSLNQKIAAQRPSQVTTADE